MNPILLIPIIISFLLTLFFIPIWIKRAKAVDLVGKDIHKIDKKDVAESGGLTVLSGFVLGVLVYVAIITFLFSGETNLIQIFALLNVVILVGLIGFVDDIFGWKIGLNRKSRLLLVLISSIPLIAINAGRSTISLPFLGSIELGLIYPLIFIPIGIAGATTTFNFLAGYNGLEAGNGILVLSAISIVAFLTGSPWLALICLIMVAALLAFLSFNFVPAKVFPGDSLTYAVGALIAITSILGNFEKIAVFFFIPYIIETVLKSRGKLQKESFSRIKADGSLELLYNEVYSLNHLSIKLMSSLGIKPTERKLVISIWIFQLLVIVIGFVLFKSSLF